jgi:phosphoribosylaminoimidazole carboxylase (NCAIR synthetase)
VVPVAGLELLSYGFGVLRPVKNEMMKRTMKTKKMILAISIAVPARTPKPKTAAINAMTRKVMAQLSMAVVLSIEFQCNVL